MKALKKKQQVNCVCEQLYVCVCVLMVIVFFLHDKYKTVSFVKVKAPLLGTTYSHMRTQ